MLMNFFSFSFLGADHGFCQQVICCQSVCQQLVYEHTALKRTVT